MKQKVFRGKNIVEKKGPGMASPVYCGTLEPTVKVSCGEELPYLDSNVMWKTPPDQSPARPVSTLIESWVFCMEVLPVLRPPDAMF